MRPVHSVSMLPCLCSLLIPCSLHPQACLCFSTFRLHVIFGLARVLIPSGGYQTDIVGSLAENLADVIVSPSARLVTHLFSS